MQSEAILMPTISCHGCAGLYQFSSAILDCSFCGETDM